MEQVIKETIVSFNEYIEKIPNGVQYIAEQLRNNYVEEAYLAINDFTEGVDWLVQVNRALDEYGFTLDMEFPKLQSHLLQINSGLLQEEYGVVADLFEYEIKPLFQNLQGYTL